MQGYIPWVGAGKQGVVPAKKEKKALGNQLVTRFPKMKEQIHNLIIFSFIVKSEKLSFLFLVYVFSYVSQTMCLIYLVAVARANNILYCIDIARLDFF